MVPNKHAAHAGATPTFMFESKLDPTFGALFGILFECPFGARGQSQAMTGQGAPPLPYFRLLSPPRQTCESRVGSLAAKGQAGSGSPLRARFWPLAPPHSAAFENARAPPGRPESGALAASVGHERCLAVG